MWKESKGRGGCKCGGGGWEGETLEDSQAEQKQRLRAGQPAEQAVGPRPIGPLTLTLLTLLYPPPPLLSRFASACRRAGRWCVGGAMVGDAATDCSRRGCCRIGWLCAVDRGGELWLVESESPCAGSIAGKSEAGAVRNALVKDAGARRCWGARGRSRCRLPVVGGRWSMRAGAGATRWIQCVCACEMCRMMDSDAIRSSSRSDLSLCRSE